MNDKVNKIAEVLRKKANADSGSMKPIKEFGASPQEQSLVLQHTSPMDAAIPNHGVDSEPPKHKVNAEGDVTNPMTDKPKTNMRLGLATGSAIPQDVLRQLAASGGMGMTNVR